jgi:RHH-type proline utilization regulon transcriptional repressor/proline dehydrogenase/delta 1-pyrroline-5-carboxylate dehydrogenase
MTTATLQALIDQAEPGAEPITLSLPGPTGESNRLTTFARPPLLCLGPGAEAAEAQAQAIRALGGSAVSATGALPAETLTNLTGFAGALYWGDSGRARAYEQALARRNGPILPLITGLPDIARARGERHLCVDTTAAGGNAALLGGAA